MDKKHTAWNKQETQSMDVTELGAALKQGLASWFCHYAEKGSERPSIKMVNLQFSGAVAQT